MNLDGELLGKTVLTRLPISLFLILIVNNILYLQQNRGTPSRRANPGFWGSWRELTIQYLHSLVIILSGHGCGVTAHQRLGQNSSLSLRQLSLKTTTLLALTRPSWSVDIVHLDISIRTYLSTDVVFKPTHLSKQSWASHPWKTFSRFYSGSYSVPRTDLKGLWSSDSWVQDSNHWFRLFLSWIGKHAPVTSSTIAHWLWTCLLEAGINASAFNPLTRIFFLK